MEREKEEIFKLNTIDRRVLFCLMNNESDEMLKQWIEYVAAGYSTISNVTIDVTTLYNQAIDAKYRRVSN